MHAFIAVYTVHALNIDWRLADRINGYSPYPRPATLYHYYYPRRALYRVSFDQPQLLRDRVQRDEAARRREIKTRTVLCSGPLSPPAWHPHSLVETTLEAMRESIDSRMASSVVSARMYGCRAGGDRGPLHRTVRVLLLRRRVASSRC